MKFFFQRGPRIPIVGSIAMVLLIGVVRAISFHARTV